jgi:hypothetical protein
MFIELGSTRAAIAMTIAGHMHDLADISLAIHEIRG